MKLVAMIFLATLVTAMPTHVLAENGWILWHESQVVLPGNSGPKEWTVAGTAKTFDQCVALQEKTAADHFKRLKSKDHNSPDVVGESILRVGSTIVATLKYGRVEIRYSCWPENRDPRGE